MKFIADCMLGRLSRWLRVLGLDVVYSPHLDDRELMSINSTQERILLTRDRELARKTSPQSLLIESEKWEEQVAQVIDHFHLLDKSRPFTRCVVCNTVLSPMPREEAGKMIPQRIYEREEKFRRCFSCGRIFWKGSHYRRMNEKIVSITRRKRCPRRKKELTPINP